MLKLDNEMRERLIETAQRVRQWAYAPYSNYKVGAALLSASGKIYEGVNIENVGFTPTVCAERVAVFKAVSEGEREFIAIAVAAEDGGAPCGVCRQVLAEFGMDLIILMTDGQGKLVGETTLTEIFPIPFTPKSLGIE
jgi:cytidine deaminase